MTQMGARPHSVVHIGWKIKLLLYYSSGKKPTNKSEEINFLQTFS